jgi:carbamoyl-phosphate synthase large subunit
VKVGLRVLLTGAGGPAAVAAIRTLLARDPAIDVYAVDIDPLAVGLYLVDEGHRSLVPRGDDPGFVDAVHALVTRWGIDVLVPTVDAELIPCADAVERFADAGCDVMVSDADALRRTIDKYTLIDALRTHRAAPVTLSLDEDFDPASWTDGGQQWPAVVKPRLGSGGRGVAIVDGPEAMARTPRDGSYVLQEMLPGREISVDVVARRDGRVVAAVPRLRLKVDSGIAVAGETLHDDGAIADAREIVEGLGLRGPLNVQFKQDADGAWKLLEINPRLPGSSPLTMAAGVDLVGLPLLDLVGEPIDDWYEFRDVAMVRHWDDVVIDAGTFDRTAHMTAPTTATATTGDTP